MKKIFIIALLCAMANNVKAQTDIPQPTQSGPLGGGSWLRFTSGGTTTSIQEAWGVNLIGDYSHPVKVYNASFLLGYTSAGENFGTNNLLVNGNVGIGTTSLSSKLNVYSGIGYDGITVQAGSTTDGVVGLKIKNSDAAGDYSWGVYGSANNVSPSSLYLYDNANHAARMIVNSSGNIGIGTSTPYGGLHIHNNVGYINNAANQLILTNSGYRNSESGQLAVDNAAMAFYFTNYNAGGKTYDRTLDIKVRGAGDGTFGAGMIRFFANDYTNGSVEREIMRIHGNGNVGIGTTSPEQKLTVLMDGSTNGTGIAVKAVNSSAAGSQPGTAYLNPSGSKRMYSYLDVFTDTYNIANAVSSNLMTINQAGNVAIGTTDTKGYKFAVAGNVIAEQVTVKLQANWPDYVFKPTYTLTPLSELKTYINQNHHLPEIPSEKEVAEKGLNLGEMNRLLTKKVEELTLYLIDKDKEIKNQQDEINRLKEQVALIVKKLK